MARRSLALVVLVLTAGCTGLFGTGETPTPVTPMPVVEQPAPGVPAAGDQSGLRVDVDRVLAANERARSNGSYTLERTVTIRGPEESLQFRHVQRAGPDGTVLERVRANGTGRLSPVFETATLWTDGSTRWSRVQLADGRTVTTELLSLESSPFLTGHPLPGRVMRGAEFAVTNRDDGASLRSTGPVSVRDPVLSFPVADPRNATVRAEVGSDGFIRTLNVTYDATFDTDRVTVTISHRTVDRGTTTVPRPDWVPVDTNRTADRRAARGGT